ncbi:hypothetical protein PPL_06627 [Heterostelium album PN500]|uniref:Ankyrin repeat protein n=1 Tax=Heterostelium pallidum (strain ATCC 26659 / Pp 5 / PN500) TaxID=670386 RepID=D3BF94_HETP5|nr:hypothetical protein PPL_06627 [Heterostelium album PN500]EFA79808.1 hypothetical protein PPL_06627 [Heterostelium album PN500]|eukprot:XP_020431929.1 hypothetical protein PPL_06627 [Heterostelium album PN500]
MVRDQRVLVPLFKFGKLLFLSFSDLHQYIIEVENQLEIRKQIETAMESRLGDFHDYNECFLEYDEVSIEEKTYQYFKKLFLDSMLVAAEVGALHLIEYVERFFPYDLDYRYILEMAVQYGHLPIVKIYINKFLYINCLFENINNYNRFLMDIAAEYGQLEILKYLYFNRYPFSKETCNLAITNGHLNVIAFLYHNNIQNEFSLNTAISYNQFEIVKFILINKIDNVSFTSLYLAVEKANFEILKFLIPNSSLINLNQCLMEKASEIGSLEIIKYLSESTRAHCSTRVMDVACSNGHLNILLYLHFNRTEGCTQEALRLAILNNHLDVVEFLVNVKHLEIDYSVHLSTIINYRTPNFSTFKYFYERIPENIKTNPTGFLMDSFIKDDDILVLEWLRFNNFEFSPNALDIAIQNNSLSTFKWFHENTVFHLDIQHSREAIINGCLPIAKYLNDVGAPFPEFPMDIAHDLQMLIYLHQNRTEPCSFKSMDNAIYHDDISMIKYLKKHNFTIQPTRQIQSYKKFSCYLYNSRVTLIKNYHL